MSGLPTGWCIASIANLATTQSGGTPSTAKAEYWDGEIPWVNSGALKDSIISEPSKYITRLGLESSSAKLFPPDTVVIALTGATTGKVGLLDFRCSTNQSVTGIFPSPALEPKYLFNFLRYSRQTILEQSIGSAQPHINKQIVDDFEVTVPPLNEQRRIVAKLEAVLGKVDSSQQRLAKIPVILKRFRQAVLAAACSGRLTADWREKNPQEAICNLKESTKRKLPPITEEEILFDAPPSWQWIRLGAVATFINGDRGKNYPNRNEYVAEGIPFINTGHIQPDGSLSADSMHHLTREKFDSLRGGKIKPGDLVYCLRGATLGKTAFVEPYVEGAIASSLVIIRLDVTLERRLAYYFLTGPYGKELIARFDNGSAQPNLSADSVKHYVFPLPPLHEQHEIVRRVEALFTLADQLEARYAKAKTHVDRLTQSILAKAFRGELVPQDASDEPATRLLERIRAQRGQATPVKRMVVPSHPQRSNSPTKATPISLVSETHAKYSSDIPQAILAHMKQGVEFARKEIVDALNITTTDWNLAIRKLKEDNKIVQTGEKRGSKYRLL